MRPEEHVSDQRYGVGSIRIHGVVARQKELAIEMVAIVDHVMVGGVRALEDVQEAVLIRVCQAGQTVWIAIKPLGNVVNSVVIAVGVEIVGLLGVFRVNRGQSRRCSCQGLVRGYGVRVVNIIQAIAVDVGAGRGFVASRGLGFHVVGDAVVVRIDVQSVHHSVEVAVRVLADISAECDVGEHLVRQVSERHLTDLAADAHQSETFKCRKRACLRIVRNRSAGI